MLPLGDDGMVKKGNRERGEKNGACGARADICRPSQDLAWVALVNLRSPLALTNLNKFI